MDNFPDAMNWPASGLYPTQAQISAETVWSGLSRLSNQIDALRERCSSLEETYDDCGDAEGNVRDAVEGLNAALAAVIKDWV